MLLYCVAASAGRAQATPLVRRFGMESAVKFFHLGMSVSAYGSIRVPRVGSTR